MNICCT